MEEMRLEMWYEVNLREDSEIESSDEQLDGNIHDEHFYWMCAILIVDLECSELAASEFIKAKGYKCDTTLVKEAAKRFLKHGTPVCTKYESQSETKTLQFTNDNPSKIIYNENEISQQKTSKSPDIFSDRILFLGDEINKIPSTTKNKSSKSIESLNIQRIYLEESEKINGKERDLSQNQEHFYDLHFICPDSQCMKQFKNRYDIMNHISCYHSLKCQMPFCNFSTFVFDEYLQHFRVNHKIKPVLPAKRIVGYGHHAEF